MNLKDLKVKKPEFAREAKKCKNKFEFARVAEKYNIRIASDSFDEAYELLCAENENQLSAEMLANAAGGIGTQTTEVHMTEIGNTTILKLD